MKHASKKALLQPVFAIALLLGSTSVAPIPAAAVILPGGLAATNSGNDFILSFPTAVPRLYTVQTAPDLLGWSNVPPGVPGDGTVKSIRMSNALASGSQGFYRLLIQTPKGLQISGYAFSILGYDCGGIQEHVYVTGFDPSTGNPVGEVYLKTTCSGSGRDPRPIVHTAWASAMWDLAGNAIFATKLSNGVAASTNFLATDTQRDTIYNTPLGAYLVVPLPAAPTILTAAQVDDQISVSWTPNGANPIAITSSTIMGTPTDGMNPVITTTVNGAATNGAILSVEPEATYQITVVNTTITGSSPPSTPVSVTTSPATIKPYAPTNVVATWSNPDPGGTNDTIIVTWSAPDPGNSPIDEYLITFTASDGGGTFTQTVSGTTLSIYYSVDDVPNWTITVQAHNVAGWGAVSTAVHLGGL